MNEPGERNVMEKEVIKEKPLSEVILGKYHNIDDPKNGFVVTAQYAFDKGDYVSTRVLGSLPPYQRQEAIDKYLKNIVDLKPLYGYLNEANNIHDRVAFVRLLLWNKKLADGRNTYEIFLRKLAEDFQYIEEDEGEKSLDK